MSLALAEVLFLGAVVEVTDDRFDYGERHHIAFCVINNRLFVCVYADRTDERRVISLRKANRREANRYAQDLE